MITRTFNPELGDGLHHSRLVLRRADVRSLVLQPHPGELQRVVGQHTPVVPRRAALTPPLDAQVASALGRAVELHRLSLVCRHGLRVLRDLGNSWNTAEN